MFSGKNITGCDPYEVNYLGMARTFQQIRLFMDLTIMGECIDWDALPNKGRGVSMPC